MTERSEVAALGQKFSTEILSGLPSSNRSREMVKVLDCTISNITEPVAHGTLSGNFESILEKGLGGFFPADSFSPNRISVCSLRYPGGIFGSYAFALNRGVFLNSGLSIDARRLGGRDVVQRYVATLGVGNMQTRWAETKLRFAGALYCLRKRRMEGWPTFLIYDTKGEVELMKLKDKITFVKFPAAFAASSPLPKEMLSLVLVPAEKYQETEQILTGHNLQPSILPLEIVELKEILSLE